MKSQGYVAYDYESVLHYGQIDVTKLVSSDGWSYTEMLQRGIKF